MAALFKWFDEDEPPLPSRYSVLHEGERFEVPEECIMRNYDYAVVNPSRTWVGVTTLRPECVVVLWDGEEGENPRYAWYVRFSPTSRYDMNAVTLRHVPEDVYETCVHEWSADPQMNGTFQPDPDEPPWRPSWLLGKFVAKDKNVEPLDPRALGWRRVE